MECHQGVPMSPQDESAMAAMALFFSEEQLSTVRGHQCVPKGWWQVPNAAEHPLKGPKCVPMSPRGWCPHPQCC